MALTESFFTEINGNIVMTNVIEKIENKADSSTKCRGHLKQESLGLNCLPEGGAYGSAQVCPCATDILMSLANS